MEEIKGYNVIIKTVDGEEYKLPFVKELYDKVYSDLMNDSKQCIEISNGILIKNNIILFKIVNAMQ